ncbi:MAG: SRPBCC domain-containing protein [Deltaproteobacteria bacterium]|nr:SRPBCC domain-containing protein [Deltaproteobacteria bacterium]
MKNQPVQILVSLSAPIERVWRAWTENEELTTWLTAKANVALLVGGPYELFWEPDHPDRNSTLGCKVTAFEPMRFLAFSWRGPTEFAHLMNTEPFPTSVRVAFTETSIGETVIELEHGGWGLGPKWAEARAWQDRAWRVAFAQLETKFRTATTN